MRFLIAFFALLLAATPALAREEIRAFASQIDWRDDGAIAVTETIDVNAEGREIRRGIYRDIPVVMLDDDGNRLRPDLDVVSVTRNGAEESFRIERRGDFIRIWIGRADVILPHGQHRYVIRYRMDRMTRFFSDRDELYWNVTGNYWVFPIQRTVASVILPPGAVVEDVQGYTGPTGSSEQDVVVARAEDGRVRIRATSPLGPGEGMTISVSIDKGVLIPPTGTTQILHWLSDREDVIVPTMLALVVLLYFSLAWNAVGRDPPQGTVIPLFYPPRGFSPALVHYVHHWGWLATGWTAFTAAAFNLGVKGLLAIDNRDNTITLTATGREPAERLSAGEAVIFNYLSRQRTLTINKATGRALGQKRQEFIAAIESENRGRWFKDHGLYSGIGGLIALGSLGVMFWRGYIEIGFLVLSGVFGIFIGIAFSVLRSLWGGSKFRLAFAGIWISVVLANMFGGFSALLTNALNSSGIIAAVSIIAMCILFAVLMRAPTIQGRKVMDEIAGFKLYLETAEKERLNIAGEPPMSVERFERILPYAIALGVEEPWAEHFEAELSRNAVEDAAAGGTYNPGWYRSTSGGYSSAASSMAHTVSTSASAMSAAMVAAQPVQSSSSGSGGGGSSGGGGGGGGGGGW